MNENVDNNNIEERLLQVIDESFMRLKLDAKTYKLKEKYKEKQKNKIKQKDDYKNETSIFAKGYTGSGPSRRDPIKFGGFVKEIVKENNWDKNLIFAKIIINWEKIVGKHLAEHIRIEKIENNTIVLQVTSSTYATQLKILQAQIYRNIFEEVGVTDIKIRIKPPSSPSWKKGAWHIKGRGPRDTYG